MAVIVDTIDDGIGDSNLTRKRLASGLKIDSESQTREGRAHSSSSQRPQYPVTLMSLPCGHMYQGLSVEQLSQRTSWPSMPVDPQVYVTSL